MDTVEAQKWNWLKQRAEKELADTASNGKTITYTQLSERLDSGVLPQSEAMGRLLSEISRRTHKDRNVLLSAVVVRSDDGLPGDGFFELAAGLGMDASDREKFWEKCLEAVYMAYAKS